MQYKKYLRKGNWQIFSLLLAALFLPNLGSAQDASQDAGNQKPTAQGAPKDSDNKDAAPASPYALAWADSYIRQIGTSGVLAGKREGIGWGSLYIPSAGVSGIVDQLESTSTAPGTTFSEAVLQNTRLDWLIYTRPRWNVRFGDGFRYDYTQQSIGLSYFDVNTATSGVTTNNFLDGPSRLLTNSASLSIAYALSRRASIVITPDYTFSESGMGATLARGSSYSGTVNWKYRTSERQTVGVQYLGQLLHEAGRGISTSTTGASTDTIFHTIAGTAERQLSGTFFAGVALGITTSSLAQNTRQWSFYGTFELLKQLGRSSLGLKYSRGDTLSYGLIANQYADRVDVTYQRQLGRRLNWSAGGGYLRQVQFGGFSGWYATSDAQFLLAPRAGLFAVFDYNRKNQAANTHNLFIGNRSTYSFGIRWQPDRVAH